MIEGTYNKVKGKEYDYSDGLNIIKIYPVGQKSQMVKYNGNFKGIFKNPSQHPIGIVKIKNEKEFWIIEFKNNELTIFQYKGKQGFEFIYLQYHILKSL